MNRHDLPTTPQPSERRSRVDPSVSPMVDRRKQPWVRPRPIAAGDPWAHVRDRED